MLILYCPGDTCVTESAKVLLRFEVQLLFGVLVVDAVNLLDVLLVSDGRTLLARMK